MSDDLERKFDAGWAEVGDDLGGFFYRKGVRADDIPDLVQEVAMRAWKGIDQLRGPFRAWAFTIARRVFYDYLQKVTKEGDFPEDYVVEDTSSGPSQIAHAKVLLEQCLNELDEIGRKCVVMSVIEGKKLEKIAESLEIPVSTAHYHIDRSRKMLKEKFPDLVLQ
ncbi:MAG TPA: RNA polymerase sigma factor [bacterium]|jgi:RNA polymerase sigma factor (sigma-70 family)